MTERMIKSRIQKLNAIVAQQKALKEQAKVIRNGSIADNAIIFQKWLYCCIYVALRFTNISFYTTLDTNLKIREYKGDI